MNPTGSGRTLLICAAVLATGLAVLAGSAGLRSSPTTQHAATARPTQALSAARASASAAASKAAHDARVQLESAEAREQRAASATRHRIAQAHVFAREALAGKGPCFGAAALAAVPGTCLRTTKAPVELTPAQAAVDKSDAYGSVTGSTDCFSRRPTFPQLTCTRGDVNGRIRVALVGNSHAGQWLPALEQIARPEHWQITTYLASECAFSDTPQHFLPLAVSRACSSWVEQTTARIAHGGYDLVVVSNEVARTALGHDLAGSWAPYERGYVKVLQTFHRAQLTVVGIRDTPAPHREATPTCLAAHPQNYAPCNGTRAAWVPPEPMVQAAAALHDPRITVADLTGRFCGQVVCPAAIGNVIVYFDASHVSATYDRTLAPYLAPILRAAMAA